HQARLASLDHFDRLKGDGLLEAAPRDVTSPFAALRHGHLRTFRTRRVSVDAGQRNQGAALAPSLPRRKVWKDIVAIGERPVLRMHLAAIVYVHAHCLIPYMRRACASAIGLSSLGWTEPENRLRLSTKFCYSAGPAWLAPEAIAGCRSAAPPKRPRIT